MKKNKFLLILSGMLLCGFSLLASGGKVDNPVLHGYVTDAVTKKPVAGVLVSAVLPGSNGGLREAVTDAEGYFHFAQIPASQVNLVFDKKGYQPYKRSSIAIKEKVSVKLNVEFVPEEVEGQTDDSEYRLLRMVDTN